MFEKNKVISDGVYVIDNLSGVFIPHAFVHTHELFYFKTKFVLEILVLFLQFWASRCKRTGHSCTPHRE